MISNWLLLSIDNKYISNILAPQIGQRFIMKNLKKILNLIALINDFKQIERDIPSSSGLRSENDAEHSYQLAMICWHVAMLEKSKLNIDKILKYAMVHDLVEVYAGDTPLYTSDDKQLNSKEEREKEAVFKFKNNFPHFFDLNTWINNYKKQEDLESQYVFAMDKLLPILCIYLDKGHAWKSHNITLDMIIKKNKNKVTNSPIVKKYFNFIVKVLNKNPEILNGSTKVFKGAISHNGERCDIHHFDANDFNDIPDELSIKAHAVCFHDGKLLLVNHMEWDIWSIPGGTREAGESIEETLHREIMEETNCKVTDYYPISYQKVISPDGKLQHYRLQYVCNVIPKGEFKKDPAGNVDKIAWISPNDFEKYIEDKEFKRSIIRRALMLSQNSETKKN
jgi:putative hydrolase of HD superfamily